MNLSKLLISKSILFYFTIFMASQIFILVMCCAYYHLNDIEHFCSDTSLPFLDLHQQGNVLNWFFSLLWLLIALFSLLLMKNVLSCKEPFISLVFWFITSLVAFLMSAEMICAFTSFFFELLAKTQKENNTIFHSYILLRITLAFFVLSELFLLIQYICTRQYGRFFLFISFFCCLASFIFVFIFCTPSFVSRTHSSNKEIPSIESNETPLENKSSSPKSNQEDNKTKPSDIQLKEKSDDKETEESPYFHNVSYNADEKTSENISSNKESEDSKSEDSKSDSKESSDEEATAQKKVKSNTDNVTSSDDTNDSSSSTESGKAVSFHWEEIFGWERTLEKNLHLSKDIEDYFNMPESIESLVWKGKEPDISRLREILRYAVFGLFTCFLLLTIQMIGRSNRVVWEKEIIAKYGNLALATQLVNQQ